MLQQSADKAVVNTFCRRAHAEPFYRLLVLDKIVRQDCGKILVFHRSNPGKQFLIHRVDVVTAGRQIVCRVVLALSCLSCTLDRNLKRAVEYGDIAADVDVVKCFEFVDSHRIRIPDFRIDRTGAVL